MQSTHFTALACFILFADVVELCAAPPPDPKAIHSHLELLRANHSEQERWPAFAQQHPVAADWLAQDLGSNSADLCDPTKAMETRNTLANILNLPSQTGANEAKFWKAYIHNRSERRNQRLNPLLTQWGGLVFTEAHTFRMSFIGYTEGLSDARAERFFEPGSRLMRIDFDPHSTFGTPRVMLDDPHGMMRDVDVSFDSERVLFAWKKSDRLDDYHLYEYHLKEQHTRQITRGLGRADYEPIYLPDGDILFTSTRPEQSVPCWWTEISNIYRANIDGNGLRRLAVDQVHALYPQLMTNGRVTYTRWDYNDRGQNYPHPLFSMMPDGRDQRAFYGANSWFPNSLLHARAIPGSHEVVAVAAGHHTRQQGKLVIINNHLGRDEGAGMRFIAPRREVPYERVDLAMQHGDLFRYPYPLGDGGFFVSLQPEHGVPGFGLYWLDEDGNRELLHTSPDLGVGRMAPVAYRPAVETLAEEVDFKSKTATYHVKDVYQGTGLSGIKRGDAKWIRVVRLNYRAAGVGQTHNHGEDGGSINSAPVAIANASWDVKEILGDVEIHADGSAMFEVPAMESIYLQILDAQGKVIQTTRSWDTLRPGESKGCVGCHDKSNGNAHPFHDESTLAWKHGAQKPRHPFDDGIAGFSFHRIIQPILDSKCVSCHDGTDDTQMDLRGIAIESKGMNQRAWTASYLNLTESRRDDRNGNWIGDPNTGLVRWIHKQSRPTELPPYSSGAANSPLMRMLEEGHQGVQMNPSEMFKLAAWIDLLVPFSGDYREGGIWSERDHAYYSYYETKRGQHQREEHESLVTWLKGVRHQPDSTSPPSIDAKYRPLVIHPECISDVDGTKKLAEDSRMFITDRISLRTTKGTKIVIRGSAKAEILAEITATHEDVTLALRNPSRGDRLSIETIPGNAPLRINELHGLEVREIPTVAGYHPFLGDEL